MAFIRDLKALAVATTLMSGLSVLAATPARAQDCSFHCMAVGEFGKNAGAGSPIYLNAVYSYLTVPCLNASNTTNDFTSFEMWMYTNDNGAGLTFVEGGMTIGNIYGDAGRVGGHSLMWFWGDKRLLSSGYNLSSHFVSYASLGQSNSYEYWWDGGGKWEVYVGGADVGYSYPVGDFAGGAQVGTESTDPHPTVNGTGGTVQYADTHWNWHNANLSAFNTFDTYHLNLPTISITNGYNVAVSTNCKPIPLAVRAAQTAARAPLAVTALARVARQVGADLGGAAPVTARHVPTTRGPAARVATPHRRHSRPPVTLL